MLELNSNQSTHKLRFDRPLDSIWRLATKNNKIIISGRPSYFPTESEMVSSLNLKKGTDEILSEVPYCSRIELDEFDDTQILASLEKLYSERQSKDYFDFIIGNSSMHELCRRPSMLHIVREMIPKLINETHQSITSSELLEKYIDHWIERQESKDIQSALPNKASKKEFIKEFFTYLAGKNYRYENGNIRIDSNGISKLLRSSLFKKYFEKERGINNHDEYDLIFDKSSKEGFENEIMTGYFISRKDNEYTFVHKSFYEFFVAKYILKALKEGNLSDSAVSEENWTDEISSFIFQSKEHSATLSNESNIPFLISYTSNNELLAVCRFYVLMFVAKINDSIAFKSFLVVSWVILIYLLSNQINIVVLLTIGIVSLYLGILHIDRKQSDLTLVGEVFYSDSNLETNFALDVFFRRIIEIYRLFESVVIPKIVSKGIKIILLLIIWVYGFSSVVSIINKQFFLDVESNSLFIEVCNYMYNGIYNFARSAIYQFPEAMKTVLLGLFGYIIFYTLGIYLEKVLRVKFSAKAYMLEKENTQDYSQDYLKRLYSRIYLKNKNSGNNAPPPTQPV